MLTHLKAIVISIVGVPVTTALVVGAPIVWWDAKQNFGLKATDTPAFLLTAALAAIVVGIAVKAYWRVVVKREGKSDYPLILTKIVPLQLVIGIGLALFAANRIHEQRTSNHTYFARRYCAQVLCPVPEGELLFEDDCEAQHAGFAACFEVAWECQKEKADVPFEEREKAELRCIRERVAATP